MRSFAAQRHHSSVSVKNSMRKSLLLPPCSKSVPVKLAEPLTATIRHQTHMVLIRTSSAHKTLAELSGQPTQPVLESHSNWFHPRRRISFRLMVTCLEPPVLPGCHPCAQPGHLWTARNTPTPACPDSPLPSYRFTLAGKAAPLLDSKQMMLLGRDHRYGVGPKSDGN